MRTAKNAFTLVELLIVITILAVISVVAYTSFGGATDKAKNSSKLQHLSQIEGALNLFNQEKNYYPMPAAYSATNELWGYNSTANAAYENTVSTTMNGDEVGSVSGGAGGGKVTSNGGTTQIGAKGVITATVLGKQYLSQDLIDPALKDVKVGSDKTMSDYGVGHYVYGVYAKPAATWNDGGKRAIAYNLAATLYDEQKGTVVKVSGNYDSTTGNCSDCPSSLIGPGGLTNSGGLMDGQTGKAYPISF